jgi:hypothetical protein
MNHEALAFSFVSLETGQLLGVGLLCLEARYASVLWVGGERIVRRVATGMDWREVALELQLHWRPGLIPASTTVARLLAGNRLKSSGVHLQSVETVAADNPERVVPALDKTLRSLAARASPGVDRAPR